MKGIDISLEDVSGYSHSGEVIKKMEAIARQYTGKFILFGSRMFGLPFKVPFVTYEKVSIELFPSFPYTPHVHLNRNGDSIKIEKRGQGYWIERERWGCQLL